MRRRLIRWGVVDAMEASGSALLRRLGYRIRVRVVGDVMRESTRADVG